MDIIISLSLIMIFIFMYSFFIKLYQILFRFTGLTKEKARFQTISMITNSGFTTTESEIITHNPSRRKIASACMLTGTILSVIIVSLVINLFFNLKPQEVSESITIIIILVGSFFALLIFFKLPFMRDFTEKIVTKLVKKIFDKNDNENKITLLDVYNNRDAIAEVSINNLPECLKDKSLLECDLKNNYNLTLLLIKRNGRILDVTRDTIIQNKDVIVVFGSHQNIKDLFDYKNKKIDNLLESSYKENIITLIDNYGKDAMAEVEVHDLPEFMKETKLFSNGLKTKYKLIVLSIRRDDQLVPVNKDTVVQNGDVLVIFGNYKAIKDVFITSNTKGSNL